MELHKAIKKIVQEFGKEIIAEKRFIFMMSDYYSFRDNPADKRVIAALVDGGYTARLLKATIDGNEPIVINQIVADVYKKYGYRMDIVESLVQNIAVGVGYKANFADVDIRSKMSENENVCEAEQIDINNGTGGEVQFRGEYDMGYLIYVLLKLQKISIFHVHMDIEKLRSLLSLNGKEAQRLFFFLKKIGVLQYNVYSQDYDLGVDTVEQLVKNYNLYVSRKSGFKSQLPSGVLIPRCIIENITKDLTKNRRTSIENIKQELSSSVEKSGIAAKELFDFMQSIKIIDKAGRNVSYLTPKLMADRIAMKLCKKD